MGASGGLAGIFGEYSSDVLPLPIYMWGGDPDLGPKDGKVIRMEAFHRRTIDGFPLAALYYDSFLLSRPRQSPFTEFCGAGHNVGKEFFENTPGVLDWLCSSN